MSELLQIKGHDISLENSDVWAEKARGKKLVLIDLANCEDMTIKKRRSINVYGFPIGIMSLATYLKRFLSTLEIKLMDFGIEYSSEEELIEIIKNEKPDFIGFRAISANSTASSMSASISGALVITAFIPTPNEPIKEDKGTRTMVTNNVPPTTSNSDGTFTNNKILPPDMMAPMIIPNPPMRPARVAMSTLHSYHR